MIKSGHKQELTNLKRKINKINEGKDTKEPSNIRKLFEPMKEGLLRDANFLRSICPL